MTRSTGNGSTTLRTGTPRHRGRVHAALAALLALTLGGASIAAASPAYAAGTATVRGTLPDAGDPTPATVYLACQNESTSTEVAPGSSYELTVPAEPGANCQLTVSARVFESSPSITRTFVATGSDDLTSDFSYPGILEVSVAGPDGQPLPEGDVWFTTGETITFADGGTGRIYTGAQWSAADGPARVLDSPVLDYGINLPDGNQIRSLTYLTRPEPGKALISVPPKQVITVSGTAPASTAARRSTVSVRCGADSAQAEDIAGAYSVSVQAYPTNLCFGSMVTVDDPSGSRTQIDRGVDIAGAVGVADYALPADRVLTVVDEQDAPVTDGQVEWSAFESVVLPDGADASVSQNAAARLTGADLVAPVVIDTDGVTFVVRLDSGAAWQRRLTSAELTDPDGIELRVPSVVDHTIEGRLEGAAADSGFVSMNCENGISANAALEPDGSWSLTARGFQAPSCRLNVNAYVSGTSISLSRDIAVPAPVGGVSRMWAPVALPAPFAVAVLPDGGPLQSLNLTGSGEVATPDGGIATVSGSVSVSVPGGPVVALIPRGQVFYALYGEDGEYGGGEFDSAGADGAEYDAATDSWTLTPSADGDGIPEFIESGAPNGGDGNGDGTADADQPEVASLPGATGDYVTLASPAGTSLGAVSTSGLAGLPAPPDGATLPAGLVSFRVDGVAPGGATTVRVYSGSLAGVTGWAKYHDGAWATLPAGDVTVNEPGGYIEISLTDGGPFDDDGAANGSILDPGGPALVSDGVPPTVSCAPAPTSWSAENVSIACTASDEGSGLADAADASFTLTTSVSAGSETSAAETGSRQVCDAAGNCATAGPVTGIKVDRRGPQITITSPAAGAEITQGAAPSAAYTCTDDGSGTGSCTGSVAVGQPVPTTTTGTATFLVTATDAVGNISTRSVTYQVRSANTAPVVSADMGVTGLEEIGTQSGALALTARFTDVEGNGPFTASVQWAPGTAFRAATVTGTSVTATAVYTSSGVRTVVVKVCDATGACGTDSVIVRTFVRDRVAPVAECVVDRGLTASPRYVGRFGYTSRATIPLWIPVLPGIENTFLRDPARRGQPTVFLPGIRRSVLEVAFVQGDVGWRLNGSTATASSKTRRC